jgi:hypothetical protein
VRPGDHATDRENGDRRCRYQQPATTSVAYDTRPIDGWTGVRLARIRWPDGDDIRAIPCLVGERRLDPGDNSRGHRCAQGSGVAQRISNRSERVQEFSALGALRNVVRDTQRLLRGEQVFLVVGQHFRGRVCDSVTHDVLLSSVMAVASRQLC